MKKNIIILSIVMLCLFDKTACLAQNGTSSYDLDDIMREIIDTRIDLLADTFYFNQQLPYFQKFYDMLTDSVKIALLNESTKIWHKAGTIDNQYFIKGKKLDFYIIISIYFQQFYAKEQENKYDEKLKKEIGDSLHFVLYVDRNMVPSSKYQWYGITISKDNQLKEVYAINKGTSAILIPKEKEPVEFIIIVKYRNKYIPVNKISSRQGLSGAVCHCNLYTKKTLKKVSDSDISDDNLKDLDVYVRTVVETYRSTGIETRVRIDNLQKNSKECKELIYDTLKKTDSKSKEKKQ